MKFSRKQKQALDLGVILSAAVLAVSFLITASFPSGSTPAITSSTPAWRPTASAVR